MFAILKKIRRSTRKFKAPESSYMKHKVVVEIVREDLPLIERFNETAHHRYNKSMFETWDSIFQQ
jgi:hypothetical protein